METGLIFVSVQTEVGVFVENFFNFSFSVIGTYYTTTFTGTPKTICHLYELLSNQNVSWAQPDEDLETLRRYEFIKWIYLVPLQPALAQSNFALRQYAVSIPSLSQFINHLLQLEFGTNLSKDTKLLDVSPLCVTSNPPFQKVESQRELEGRRSQSILDIIDKYGLIRASYELRIPESLFVGIRVCPLEQRRLVVDRVFPDLGDWLQKQMAVDFEKWFRPKNEHSSSHLFRPIQKLSQIIMDLMPNANKVVTLKLNDLIRSYNQLCEQAMVPNAQLDELGNVGSYNILGLILTSDECAPVKLKLNNGRYLILTTEQETFDDFTTDELREILLALELCTHNSSFDPIRLRITEYLAGQNKSPGREK